MLSIVQIRKLLKEKLGLYFSGFGFTIEKGDTAGYSLVHKATDVALRASFDCLLRSNGKELSGGAQYISFIAIEAVIVPLVAKHRLNETPTATYPVDAGCTIGRYDTSSEARENHLKLASVHIDNEADIDAYCEVLKEYLEGYAFPWFEQYSKLEAVNELINSLGMQDILNSFSGPFPGQFFRAIVIAAKCGNAGRAAEIKEECLRRFKECETDSFYTKEMIDSYNSSLQELCGELGL
jgi:hypothetical protein